MTQKLLSIFVLFVTLQINAQNETLSFNVNKFFDRGLSSLPIKSGRTISFYTDEASWIDVDVSPNGKMLLCSFMGNLYSLSTRGGTAKQLTRGLAINRYPVWSPDQKYFAYISDASGFIQVHISDSTGNFHKIMGQLKSDLRQENLKLLWFPNNRQVLVTGLFI
jgi:Tol biopolymer transport system component